MTQTFNLTEHRDAALAAGHSDRNVHDHLKHLSVPELQEVSMRDRWPWHSCFINVTGDLNVGTMIRTSHCLGAASVTIFGRRRFDRRGLVGSANYIQVDQVPGMLDDVTVDRHAFYNLAHQRRWIPVFVETGGQSVTEVNWQTVKESVPGYEICLVMGNETGGIPQDILQDRFGTVVSIPQRGVIRSLNVSTAHAVVAGAMCAALGWM
ncbi:SpoU rRNA methylases [uncultured Caudovirales phage]|uniref:SpoU rRNA methylases n=1 Tax=uncultured Caudovirales phage TaxID=2100421 RepID=A0A6J5KNG5_9CAUD|nr:SpoU rRNA methylases [uncultured Caudovirales phage]